MTGFCLLLADFYYLGSIITRFNCIYILPYAFKKKTVSPENDEVNDEKKRQKDDELSALPPDEA